MHLSIPHRSQQSRTLQITPSNKTRYSDALAFCQQTPEGDLLDEEELRQNLDDIQKLM